jgi:hypothetical protein
MIQMDRFSPGIRRKPFLHYGKFSLVVGCSQKAEGIYRKYWLAENAGPCIDLSPGFSIGRAGLLWWDPVRNRRPTSGVADTGQFADGGRSKRGFWGAAPAPRGGVRMTSAGEERLNVKCGPAPLEV